MKQAVSRFFCSAFLYWFVASFAGYVLEMPEKIITVAAFLPPILGLMWGLPAAFGVFVGAIFVTSGLNEFFLTVNNLSQKLMYFVWIFWLFIAAYLPPFLWHRIMIGSEKDPFSLSSHTLKKFIAIMFITFLATAVYRTLIAPPIDLDMVAGLFGIDRSHKALTYFMVCLMNDFFITIFLDLPAFFFMVGMGYKFYNPAKESDDETSAKNEKTSTKESTKEWFIALLFYLLFPIGVTYLNEYEIYGMNNIETWMRFISECLVLIDVYLIMMLYLMLGYRRSIMMEVAFLVTQTVFFSATVLGWSSSFSMSELVSSHTKDSLHAMSAICRERLYRTFFCIRQAVNGMEVQAVDSLESYDKLVNDANYRKEYLTKMKHEFGHMAVGIDGAVSYYYRLIPEIEGTKGGFSVQREDARWEGALSPFADREPVDLEPYSPDDAQNVGWFYVPYRSRCPTWIEPYTDPVTKFYVISYVAPLYVEGKFIGVVGMDIDFNFIIQELRRMSIYDYGYVYIMNRNDRVLYHREQPQGAVFQTNPEYQEMEIYLANGMWLGIATPLAKVNEERNIILMHLVSAIMIVAMLISAVSISFAAKAIKPLAGMTEAARRIASGDLNVKLSYESGNELGLLVRSIREMAEKLEIYVYRDKLTGLKNAAAYISKGKELNVQDKLIKNLAYAVVVFDVNFLKKVNDNYGHQGGNQLLRHASRVICRVFSHSPVYRVGGDEFAAILEQEDYENRDKLLKLFDEKIAEESFEFAGDTINVSVARGIGIYKKGMDFSAVAKIADNEMYLHKALIKAKYGEEIR